MRGRRRFLAVFLLSGLGVVAAQVPPSANDLANYSGLFRAVATNDANALEQALAAKPDLGRRDRHGRSALHVAAYFANHAAMRRLVAAGADPNALEADFYDIATIAAVADDLATLKLALQLGCRPGNVTSRYDGTALIAAAHLGHAEVVDALIRAGAPLDHVNNLNWTALIEAIVLGDGGPRHVATLRALVDAGADINLPDRSGNTPLALARIYGHAEMIRILEQAGAQ